MVTEITVLLYMIKNAETIQIRQWSANLVLVAKLIRATSLAWSVLIND